MTAGLLAAPAATRGLASLLYGIPRIDWVTYTAAAVLILAVATLASWLPALRAARLDPSDALRRD
jgi:ABC-type lipoprotein release transport system permease subunit